MHSVISNGVRGNADIVLLRAEIRRLEDELGTSPVKSDKKRKAGLFSYMILAVFIGYAVISLLRGAGIDIPRVWGVF